MKLTVKQGFKFSVGAYLGWCICEALDKTVGKRLAPKIQPLIDKLNDKIEEDKKDKVS